MNINETQEITVTGIAVRTKNADEMSPATAKIGSLWETFYSQFGPQLSQSSQVYGLYTNYESDHTGEFDVAACASSLDIDDLGEFKIPAGKYLVFHEAGAMPQAVIDLWGKVWDYFASQDCEHVRTFTTDFERYINQDEIEICIAVE